MDCAHAVEYIELNALQPLDEEQALALQQHLAVCGRCSTQSEQLTMRLTQLRRDLRTPDFETPALRQLRRRVRRELWTDRVVRKARLAFPALARAAAALVICAGLLYAWHAVRDKAGGTCACTSWTQAGMTAIAGNNTAYPLVSDREIFALVDEPDGKYMLTIDRHTGARLWQTPFPVAGLPCFDLNRVYVWNATDSSGLRLVALKRRTGEQAWIADNTSLPLQAKPSAITSSGQHLCWSGAGSVGVLDAKTGRKVWMQTLTHDGPLSAPMADDQRLYVASGEALYALALVSGNIVWQRDIEPGRTFLSQAPLLQCADDRVAVACATMPRRGRLQTFRAATGEQLWRRDTVAPQHLLAAQGKLYVRGAGIQAFDGQTGNLAWMAPISGCSPLAAKDDLIYVMEGIERQGIFALQADTGQRVWDKQQLSSCSGFVISGKMGYLVTQQGELRAIAI